MKSLVLALALLSAAAQADTVVKKDLGTFRNWKAALVGKHAIWDQDGCMASTKASGNNSTLEVFALEQAIEKEGHAEPTIQVVARKVPEFVRGILKTDDSPEMIHLTLATNQDPKPGFGLMARLDDRAKIVAKLKSSTTVTIEFVNSKSKVIKSLAFSTKGFTKAMDAITAKCELPAL